MPGGYADWVTLTRPYYDSRNVFATDDPDTVALAEVPPGRPIGATMGTTAHFRLISYVGALPQDERWPVFPMGTNDIALGAVREGTVEAALVWAPNLWAKQRADPAYVDLRAIDPDPLPATTLGVGALLLSDETFLRAALDEAIAALRADGTIAGILADHDFPATAGP